MLTLLLFGKSNTHNRSKNHILNEMLQMLDMQQHGTQQTINQNKEKTVLTIKDTDTEERKRWVQGVKLWQQKKDAQCIVMHGYGWHYDIDTDTCVKD
jgi:hypothetical protein